MSKRSKTAVWLPIVATLLFCVLAILSGRLQKQEAIGNVVSEQMTFPNGTDVSLSAGGAYGMVESEGPGLTPVSYTHLPGQRQRRDDLQADGRGYERVPSEYVTRLLRRAGRAH